MPIKLSDYVAKTLSTHGVSDIFLVTGGGAMHLNDSLGHQSGIHCICNHHEQACAMAAEGYARVSGKIGVLNVTTGPGGINALNGVFGAWTDSIPMLVISGQVKRETCLYHANVPGLRQLGDQEADIIPMVKGITKYAVMVTDPNTIRYHLERALYLAEHGRPGPCWLDIPLDVQAAPIEEEALAGYDPAEDAVADDAAKLPELCREILEKIKTAECPVIVVGTGIHVAHAEAEFERVIRKLGIPVTTAWTAHDLMASDDPLFCGRPSTLGDRAGNFAVQNADLLLVLGSRLNVRQVSYNWQAFAPNAYKIWVDIDPAELAKPTVKPDLPVVCDLQLFLEKLAKQIDNSTYALGKHAPWLAWCKERVVKYPVTLPRHRKADDVINPYHFIETLFDLLKEDDIIVCGNGSACVVPFQTGQIKKGQRMFANSGCASMGYDLPAAIGAAVAAAGGKRVICLAGDGSLQMNIQELQTVAQHQYPIKLFVLDNRGYASIRQTQGAFFKRFIGEGATSGVSFPDMVKIGAAYGLASMRISGPDFAQQIQAALEQDGPMVAEVMLDPQQIFEPKLSSKQLPDGRIVSPSLEDMFPFLDKEELQSNTYPRRSKS